LLVNVLVNLIAVNQMDPYDSDSSDGGSEFPSRSTIPETPTWNYLVGRIVGQSFSSVKKLITSERHQLEEDIIEACECLKAWWRNCLIEQQFGHFKKQKQ
jgi:hypothetical protein